MLREKYLRVISHILVICKKNCINKSFYVKPANVDEILEIISDLDINKSLGPNSLPIYITRLFEKTNLRN